MKRPSRMKVPPDPGYMPTCTAKKEMLPMRLIGMGGLTDVQLKVRLNKSGLIWPSRCLSSPKPLGSPKPVGRMTAGACERKSRRLHLKDHGGQHQQNVEKLGQRPDGGGIESAAGRHRGYFVRAESSTGSKRRCRSLTHSR